MKTMQLGEILTEDQIHGVLKIITLYHDDPIERIKKLKEYLIGFRESLEAKGVLPEYLAYVIEAQLRGLVPTSPNASLN